MKINNLELKIKRKGVSLVELLIGVGVLGSISVLFAVIIVTTSRIFSDQKTNVYLASQNRLALNEISNQVREAAGIAINCTVCEANNTSNSMILILQLWPINANGDPFDPGISGYDYIVYRLHPNNKNLLKKVYPTDGNGSTRTVKVDILASDVINMTFCYDGICAPDPQNPGIASEVTINLTNEASSIHKTHSFTQSSKAVLRNK